VPRDSEWSAVVKIFDAVSLGDMSMMSGEEIVVKRVPFPGEHGRVPGTIAVLTVGDAAIPGERGAAVR